MDLFFLGTSAATPTKDRNLPATALRLENGEIILFDAGEDVQRRFETALKMNVPTTICISHLHGDHILGLPGLFFNFHLGGRTAPLILIGPRGLHEFLIMHLMIVGLKIDCPFTIIEILPQVIPKELENRGNSPVKIRTSQDYLGDPNDFPIKECRDGVVHKTNSYQIKIAWMKHSVPTMGFRLEENEQKGRFYPEKAVALKIPEGRLWGRLQKGDKLQLPDGRIIDPIAEGVVGPKRPGTVVVYTGDTIFFPELVLFCKEADALIAECTYAQEDEQIAIEKMHMSSRMAAELAKEAQVGTLFLTHFSSRYKDLTTLEQQARTIFPNVYAGIDLLSVKIKPKE